MSQVIGQIRPWPSARKLRRWQEKALRRLRSLEKSNALVVATPGAGKTALALRHAHDLLTEGSVERVVIVCPSNHLRRQWADAAHEVGIDIDPRFSNEDGMERQCFSGVAVTYQQVVRAQDLYSLQCRDRKTLVILDECHHTADELTWGTGIQVAFEKATFRLLLSGTPFRSDNYPIPFVDYHEGRSRADFEYGYGGALEDAVCRPLFFPCYEGMAVWLSRVDGSLTTNSLLDDLDRVRAAERLRTILDPRCDWLPNVLADAHASLLRMRAEGHPEASGLVLALDQNHAREIAGLIRGRLGVEPSLAISDMDDASERIREFAREGREWIVAVKMISEGVDLPNLRIAVFATNVNSLLFFRQVCGRVVRVLPGLDEQHAELYIPAVEPYLTFALEIKQEHDHQLRQELEVFADGCEVVSWSVNRGGDGSPSYLPLSAGAKAHEVIYDSNRFSRAELRRAAGLGRSLGLRLPPEQIAALVRVGAADAGTFPRIEIPPPPAMEARAEPAEGLALYVRLQSLRRGISRLANQLAFTLGVQVRDVHAGWIAEGGLPHAAATDEDLLRKQAWLVRRLKEVNSAVTARQEIA